MSISTVEIDVPLTLDVTVTQDIANAKPRHDIERIVENHGYACPVICTPEELMED
jgi:hypothetical protein